MSLDTANKVPIKAFLELQRLAVKETRASMRTIDGAARLLELHGLGSSYKIPSIFIRLQKFGLKLERCGSLGMTTVLKVAETDILRDLKYHARIPVPESWKLVGIADEFNYLKEGEIYGSILLSTSHHESLIKPLAACVRDKDGGPIYLKGPYVITRSPVIHP
jgi:RNA-dependent RNA polymerase